MNIQTISCTNLRIIRKNLGLSQKEFAEKLGVSQPHLGNIEAGSRNITYEIIGKLTEIYKISPNWLLLGVGDVYLSEEITPTLPADIKELIRQEVQEALKQAGKES